VRRTLALLAAAFAAVFIAVVMGEYVLTLWTAIAAGVVVGFLLAEIVLGIAYWRGFVPAVVVGALGGASIAWAARIETAGLQPIRNTAWVGVVLAVVVGAARLRPRAAQSSVTGDSTS